MIRYEASLKGFNLNPLNILPKNLIPTSDSHSDSDEKRVERSGKRKRRLSSRRITTMPIFLLSFVIFALLSLLHTANGEFQQSTEPQCFPEEPTKYDWERFNYYQLLGLTDDDDKKKKKRRKKPNDGTAKASEGISAKEVRKAYRKQAQKYHPDKQASKKKASENNSSGNHKKSSSTDAAISIEESNARFAKIAEAYEFLLDDSKREDYDLFLEYCQNTEIVKDDEDHEGRLSTVIKKRFHGLFDNLVGSRDPFKVFKDVFFGNANANDAYFDPNDPFSHLRYENNPQRHPNSQEYHPDEEPYDPQEDPLRIFHDKHEMYDPMTGENVIRVMQTEEYPPSTSREAPSTRGGNSTSTTTSFYYRIVAQDFRESYDPLNARQVYVPITEPYLQEDGFRTEISSKSKKQAANSKSSAAMESILHSWEVLTPQSPPIVSPNNRYVAGLSADCELLVMVNPEYSGGSSSSSHTSNTNNHEPVEILWSTQRPYGKNGYAAEHCFALLKGPHLVVTIGQNPKDGNGYHNSNRILWHSDARHDEDDSRHGYYEYEDEFGFWHKRQRSYLAQLDNDGSFTVYSVWSVPQDDSSSNKYSASSSKSRYQTAQLPRHQLLISNVAKAAEDFWHGRTSTNNEYDHLYSSSRSLTYRRCVYSTHGTQWNLPQSVCCTVLSRKIHQLTAEAHFLVRKLVFRFNLVADTWLDLIYEEDDLFYFFKESSAGFFGNLAGSSTRWVRKVLEQIKQLSPKK